MQKKLLSTERYKGYSYIFESRYSSDPVELRDYLNPIDVDKFVEGTAGEKFFQARARARRAADSWRPRGKLRRTRALRARAADARTRARELGAELQQQSGPDLSAAFASPRPPPRGNVFAGNTFLAGLRATRTRR